MADTLTRAQSYPVAATLTDLYTVPGATKAIIKALTACNQSSTEAALVRASMAVAGAADEAKQYLAYDVLLLPNESKQLLADAEVMATTDVLRVRATTGLVSFNASILEIT